MERQGKSRIIVVEGNSKLLLEYNSKLTFQGEWESHLQGERGSINYNNHFLSHEKELVNIFWKLLHDKIKESIYSFLKK
ncbi:hypothetical protein [Candidatus Phytoplasma sacchari]